jgi:hypothetical protein
MLELTKEFETKVKPSDAFSKGWEVQDDDEVQDDNANPTNSG